MENSPHTHLSRRETQVMDVLYQLGEAAVNDVTERLDDAPAYNAVRATMRVLEEKGHVTHRREGRRYVYRPVTPRPRAQRTALRHLVDTLFQGSAPRAMATLIDLSSAELDDEDLDELAEAIARARRTEKGGAS
ncbi:MAG: BlaI/MecI/CopY family transcriptional regulator [Gemmatimonadota bacterium]|nr:BlaI/MecI/CopY family transcriptional regulator [Gemmatimonadota bacterium]